MVPPNRFRAEIESLNVAVFGSEAQTDADLRARVARRAQELTQVNEDAATDIPSELVPYIDKVARHAYKVVDQDVEALLQAGYSEDAIFELTVSAACGAAMERLERGLQALRGSNP